MAEPVKEMKQLQELLQDERLRGRLQEAREEDEVVKILNEAGEAQGITFENEWLSGLFADVKLTRSVAPFSERELQELASTYMMADTPPKLCHTESCGGGHAGCC